LRRFVRSVVLLLNRMERDNTHGHHDAE
jgi:hypothetical protein